LVARSAARAPLGRLGLWPVVAIGGCGALAVVVARIRGVALAAALAGLGRPGGARALGPPPPGGRAAVGERAPPGAGRGGGAAGGVWGCGGAGRRPPPPRPAARRPTR